MRPVPGSPTDRLLTLSMSVAPLLYLLADSLYAYRGWDDPTAAIFHVAGAVTYTLVLIRVLTWTENPVLSAVLLVVGSIGVAGNVAYGFNTIHVSLGDTDLVDASGTAAIIKPLGICFPLMLLLCAAAIRRIGPMWAVALVAISAVAFPAAHIANIGWLAVVVELMLVAGLGAVSAAAARSTAPEPAPSAV